MTEGLGSVAPEVWWRWACHALQFLLARRMCLPLRADGRGMPRTQAAARRRQGQARRRWTRRPHELAEQQSLQRSAVVQWALRPLVFFAAGRAARTRGRSLMTQTGRESAHAAPCAATAATLDRHCVLGAQQEQRMHGLTLPNVRAKLAPTAWRAGQQAQNGPQAQRLMASVTCRWGSA